MINIILVHRPFQLKEKKACSNANIAWNDAKGKVRLWRDTNDNSKNNFSKNGKNEVFKRMDYDVHKVGICRLYRDANKKIIEFDIMLNTAYPFSTSGASNAHDVQSIMSHELGHALFSNDLYDDRNSKKTMYYGSLRGETFKRTLEPSDIKGLIEAYK